MGGPAATLIGGVDRAAFVTAFGQRLRASGVPVGLTGLQAFSDALEVGRPARVAQLYWLARVTLVQRRQDLSTFDRVSSNTAENTRSNAARSCWRWTRVTRASQ